jgi:protein O-GlcNAc transferase
MDYQRFLHQLPALFDDWGQPTVRPKSERFQQALSQMQGMTTPSVMQVLNFALDCAAPNELYCEVGTFRGSTLVGALLGHGDRMAYAVDNFSEFDPDGSGLEELLYNLKLFELEEQVYFCNQDFQQFFLELQELNADDKIGVYFFDGAHDYRSTLMGLLMAKPFLADQALILLDDANWPTVQQAYWDFLSVSVEAQVLMQLATPVPCHASFWNGIHILSWDRFRSSNYPPATFREQTHPSVLKAIYNVQLLEQRSESLDLMLQEARQLHQTGAVGQAEQKYQDYLLWRDADSQAWLELGCLYYEAASYAESYNAFLKAYGVDANNGQLCYYLGCALEQIRQPEAAISAYQKAIELDSGLINAYNNLGNLLSQQKQFQSAAECFQRAIAVDPNFAGTYLNWGNLCYQQGQLNQAIAHYQTAVQLAPDHSDARANLQLAETAVQAPIPYYYRLATECAQWREYATAVQHFQQCVALRSEAGGQNPDCETPELDRPEFYAQFADCLERSGQVQLAIARLEAGLARYPDSEALHYDWILMLSAQNQTQRAIAAAETAVQRFPHSYTFRLLKALLLPLVYASLEDIQSYRDRYQNELQALVAETSLDSIAHRQSALAGIARFSSFYLTYQAQSMVELQQQYGALVHRIMAANYPDWAQPRPMPTCPGKLRVGYISHYFHAYSGTLWLTGWLKHHNHQQVEIYCYYTGNAPDAVTEAFQTWSDVFHHLPDGLEAVCQQVLRDQLHVVIFPEIGMDPITIQLAALRLAPIQCTAWGHPVTSGLPTIDYYLSSQLMEPDNGEQHYSEQLVRLPNLGIAYPQPQVPAVTQSRAAFGLRDDSVVYLCCQAPFKYLPQHDRLLVQIAQQVPQAQFVFIRADILRSRLHAAFTAANLDIDKHCVFLPVLPRSEYLMLNQLADVYLDTIGFTGGNMTMDAIACGLPVVTLPGEFMRGRLSYGILQRLGLSETIARTEAEYGAIAIQLGQNPHQRQQLAATILERLQNPDTSPFEDATCVLALEAFLQEACGWVGE